MALIHVERIMMLMVKRRPCLIVLTSVKNCFSGNKKGWWKPEAQSEFDKRTKCLVDLYNTYTEKVAIKQKYEGHIPIWLSLTEHYLKMMAKRHLLRT